MMKMITEQVHFLCAALLCLFVLAGCASTPRQDSVVEPVPAATRTATRAESTRTELTQALDSIAQAPVEDGQLAGLSVAVVQGTETLLMEDYGLADLGLRVPMPDDAVHEIGSVTKHFTAAAILQLAEAGKLDIDDELTDYLPDFPTRGHRITLRHLLNHTSGIADYSELGISSRGDPGSYEALLEMVVQGIAAKPFDFIPGSRMIYNNSNSFMLGLVVEAVSGMSWEDYVEQEMFAPMGMSRTRYCHEAEVIEDRAHGYRTEPDGTFLRARLDHRWTQAAGSLCSSTGDLIIWQRALHGGRVLGEAAYREMVTPDTLEDGHPLRYAKNLAVMNDPSGHHWIGHGNNNPGFRSEVRYYPEHDLHIVVLMNTRGTPRPQEMASALALEVLGPGTQAPAVPYRDGLDRLTGRYSGLARYGRTLAVEIERNGDGLTMRMNDDESGKPLRYLGEGLWEACCYSPLGSEHLRFVVEPERERTTELHVDSGYGHYVLERDALEQEAAQEDSGHLLMTRVDAIFSDLDREDSPGCAVGVYRAGEVVFTKGYGMASLEHAVPLSPRSVLGAASVAKQFTALAIVVLAQRGELSLDDPVRRHLPKLPGYAAEVTIRQLIHHTSGIRDYFALLRLAREQVDESGEELVLSVLDWQEGLNFRPGEHWMYNTGGYVLLARIVEGVTGESFPEFMEREIFSPLGMDDSGFFRGKTGRNQALAYAPAGPDAYRLHVPTHSLAGQGGLFTTVEDLAAWDRNFYTMEVGGPEAISLLHVPGRLSSGEETGYAFGLYLGSHRGLRTVWHSGGDKGYASMLLRLPDLQLSVGLLCNTASASPWLRAYDVADLYLAEEFSAASAPADGATPEPTDVEVQELQALAGVYRSKDGLVVQRFAYENGTLVASVPGATFPLIPVGGLRFQDGLTPFMLTFSESEAGGIRIATWSPNPRLGGRGPLHLERVGSAWNPPPERLVDYAGAFSSRELDATWLIVAENGKLLLRRLGLADQPLEPLLRDTFSFRGSTSPRLRFERDGKGRVTQLTVSTEQILNLELAREPRLQFR